MKKHTYSKFMKAIVGTAVVASAFVAQAPLSAEASSVFPDVKASEYYYDAVQSLVERNVINGYTDGLFHPQDAITRGQAAKIIAEVLGYDTENVTNPNFSDVDTNHPFYGAIAALENKGIIVGAGDGTYKPNDPIQRLHLAKIIENAFNLESTNTSIPFTDVPKEYETIVASLYENGITTGKTATIFDGSASASRGEFAVFIHRAENAIGAELPTPEPQPQPVESAFELSIIHTNDTHAHIANAPKRATIINDVREEKPNALLLDAGDVFQGTLYFTEYKGQADLALMNYMGYDAMTLGNHEFDLGKTAEGHQAIVDFIKGANFPILTSNVNFSADEKFNGLHQEEITSAPEAGNIYDGMIVEVDGEKVGIFGLTTETTKYSSSPEKVTFENYLEEAEKAVTYLEGQGVDKIIALTHLGYNNPADSNDLILAEEVEGIDIIIGGHSHTTLKEAMVVDEDGTPTVIVQTGNNSANVGTLDVEFDENGIVVRFENELIKIDDAEVDPGAAEILAKFAEGIAAVENQETGGFTNNPLENPRLGDEGNTGISVRNHETALGNLVADSMLAEGKKIAPNATIAIQNGGGVRSAVDVGPITMGDVLKVLSFNNGLYSVEATGAELRKALENFLSADLHESGLYLQESGSFPHVAGLKIEFDRTKPAGERIVSIQAADENGNYAPLDDAKMYTLITNSYIATGSNFADAVKDGRSKDIGLSDWESFAKYLGNTGEVNPQVEGRVVDVAGN